MNTTREFLGALKAKNGGASDYFLSKVLGCTRAAVSRYQNGKSFFDNDTAIRVAALLQIDAGFVVACCHLERAKSEQEKSVWQGIAARFKPEDFVLC